MPGYKGVCRVCNSIMSNNAKRISLAGLTETGEPIYVHKKCKVIILRQLVDKHKESDNA